jgi:seryl-tRNA synthetase
MGGLDINWFRADKGYDPNIIRKSLERRFRDPKIVDAIIEKDLEWRKSNYPSSQSAMNSIRSKRNGTISANSSGTRRRRTRKTPVRKRLNSKIRMSSSKRL